MSSSSIETKHMTDSTNLNDSRFAQETEKTILQVIAEYKHHELPQEFIFRQNGQNAPYQLWRLAFDNQIFSSRSH